MERKQAAAATAKSERDAARDVARPVDLDKQAAILQLKKDSGAAQLQLDAQHKRAVSDVDVEFQRHEAARTRQGLTVVSVGRASDD